MRSRTLAFLASALVGAGVGWMLGQRQLQHNRNDLFSPHPLRRLSALGFLAGQEDVETARLLRDYLAWERNPVLQRRARSVLRHLEATLA